MRKSIIVISTLSALGIAVVYDKVKQATGMGLTALLWVAIFMLIFGLYTGLYRKNRHTAKD